MHELDALGRLDLVIDGADEADPNLDLIKGAGGALLREKIVAASAERMVVIADESKLVARLGGIFPVPVEVIAFGHVTTRARICAAVQTLGYEDLAPNLRVKSGEVFRTDSGNVIYDCPFGAIADVPALAAALSPVTGVVEHGLFVNMASALVIAGAGAVRVIERIPS